MRSFWMLGVLLSLIMLGGCSEEQKREWQSQIDTAQVVKDETDKRVEQLTAVVRALEAKAREQNDAKTAEEAAKAREALQVVQEASQQAGEALEIARKGLAAAETGGSTIDTLLSVGGAILAGLGIPGAAVLGNMRGVRKGRAQGWQNGVGYGAAQPATNVDPASVSVPDYQTMVVRGQQAPGA